MYDRYENIPVDSRKFIEAIYEKDDLITFYRQCRDIGLENKDVLVKFKGD